MPSLSESDRDAEEAPTTVAEPKPRAPRKKLSTALVNFWLDAALLVTIAFVGWVSAMLQIVFPAPTLADGWALWGLSYNQWRDVQFFSICFIALVILVHVMLHWNWVCSVIAAQVLRRKARPDDGMQTIYGVATLIVLLNLIAGTIIAALLMVQQPPA